MNTINRDKPKSKLKEFFSKDGIVAYLAIILTIYSLYKQWDSSNPKLTGGVRMVVKGTYIRTFVDDSPPEMRTAYTLYVQLTNTGKVPIDINYITIEALQEGEFHNLLIMLDPLSYLRMHQPLQQIHQFQNNFQTLQFQKLNHQHRPGKKHQRN